MKRRDVLRGLSLLPIGTSAFPFTSIMAGSGIPAGKGPLVPGPQIFQSIGVEPVINCMGTYTIIGGSLERLSVRAAMEAASRNFVQYDELANGIGERMAEITGAEWGMVSAGCAAGLKHVTAACVAGGNPEKLIRIPDLTGFDKTEVVIPLHCRNAYDHAIRNIGVKIINVETEEEFENALGPRTAMIYAVAGSREPLSLETIARIAKPKGVPILIDAAAEDLTIPCIHLVKGATIVAYSGGKAFCGPQCSGILLGRKDILQSAWQASSPHHGPGRDNKVGREEMIGALAAIEAWITFNHKEQWKKWLFYLETVSRRVSKIDGVKTSVRNPQDLSNNSPVLEISWNADKLHIDGQEVAEELGRNKPRIALAFGRQRGTENDPGSTSVNITSGQMQPGEDKIVADRIYAVLAQKRSPKSTGMKEPALNIQGRWDIEVEFYSSTSPYTWMLEQDGNWIRGTHKGAFFTQDIFGSIEANQVRLRSPVVIPGNRITYIYSGTVSGDSISGSIYLVEYGTAKFTAKRYKYPDEHTPVVVPGGPPLAT